MAKAINEAMKRVQERCQADPVFDRSCRAAWHKLNMRVIKQPDGVTMEDINFVRHAFLIAIDEGMAPNKALAELTPKKQTEPKPCAPKTSSSDRRSEKG